MFSFLLIAFLFLFPIVSVDHNSLDLFIVSFQWKRVRSISRVTVNVSSSFPVISSLILLLLTIYHFPSHCYILLPCFSCFAFFSISFCLFTLHPFFSLFFTSHPFPFPFGRFTIPPTFIPPNRDSHSFIVIVVCFISN